jgi:hypothetical protein
MTGTDFCVNIHNQSRSYLNHLVHTQFVLLSVLPESPMTVKLKITVFWCMALCKQQVWGVMPSSLVEIYQHRRRLL